jgi:N-acetylglucosaminyldiphosphoundecaprenol N-acetyl-beta-D-mannosaminyltransferase
MTAEAEDRRVADRPPIAILGVPLDAVTSSEALSLIEQMIRSRRPHYLVTANIDFLVQATRDVELRRILFDAHLVLCDGTPLVWASRLLGNALPERVAGADLVPVLMRRSAQKGYRVFLLGADPTSLQNAVAKLQSQCAEFPIAGYYSPPFNRLLEMDHDEIKRRILAAKPDLLLVAFGCPKQEKWISMHYRELQVPVIVGVGGSIDFLAGQFRRAPVWMQRAGAEWLFRLVQEPRRLFGRYARDVWVFSRFFLAQWWQLKLRPTPRARHAAPDSVPSPLGGTTPITSSLDGAKVPVMANQCICVSLPARLDAHAARETSWFPRDRMGPGNHCLLEADAIRFIDSTGVGLLIHWHKRLQALGSCLVLVNPSVALRRALGLLRLDEFFLAAATPVDALALIRQRVQSESVNSQHHDAVGGDADLSRAIIDWHGEVTAATIGRFREQTLVRFQNSAESVALEIGLSDVTFVDSSGLGLMVQLKKMARGQGRVLVFVGFRPAVLNVIRIAGLTEFLTSPPRAKQPAGA